MFDCFDENDPVVRKRIEAGELFPVKEIERHASNEEDEEQEADSVAYGHVPADDPSEERDGGELMSIADAQSMYQERFGKPVPSRFKNDLDWIASKLVVVP